MTTSDEGATVRVGGATFINCKFEDGTPITRPEQITGALVLDRPPDTLLRCAECGKDHPHVHVIYKTEENR